MNKKGFTLVELLSVIAILAILVIIALPNVLSMFNNAKKGSFETEAKNIYATAEEQWISDSFSGAGTKVYSHCASGCSENLNINARDNLEYYIEFNSKGNVIKYYVTDGNYQFRYDGLGLKKTDIKDVAFVPEVGESDKVVISDLIVGPTMEICIIKSNTITDQEIVTIPEGSTRSSIGRTLNYYYPESFITCYSGGSVLACSSADILPVNSQTELTHNSTEGCYSSYYFSVCLDGDSEVAVYDKKKKKKLKKKLKDVTPDDLLLAWDFDNNESIWLKPFKIMTPVQKNSYTLLSFDDGSTLKVIGDHKIYNSELNKFVTCSSDIEMPIGMKTINSDGKEIVLLSKEVYHEECLACNVITEKHVNVYVNGILTYGIVSSNGADNLYTLEDVKYY